MNFTQKKESLTRLLRVSDKALNYFITTDQITGKRFAVAESREPGSVNIKSNFMTFKEMECYLFGVNALTNNTLKFEKQDPTKLPIYWSTAVWSANGRSSKDGVMLAIYFGWCSSGTYLGSFQFWGEIPAHSR